MTTKTETKHVPRADWGKDHWSALLYVETRNVDYDGWLSIAHLRTDGKRYPTRLVQGRKQENHSDIDCLKDLEAAGLMTGGRDTRRNSEGAILEATYRYILTEEGWEVAHKLRRWRAAGNPVARFGDESKLPWGDPPKRMTEEES